MAVGWRPRFFTSGPLPRLLECPRDMAPGFPQARDPREGRWGDQAWSHSAFLWLWCQVHTVSSALSFVYLESSHRVQSTFKGREISFHLWKGRESKNLGHNLKTHKRRLPQLGSASDWDLSFELWRPAHFFFITFRFTCSAELYSEIHQVHRLWVNSVLVPEYPAVQPLGRTLPLPQRFLWALFQSIPYS